MAHSFIVNGMKAIRRWDLDKPDPEVGLCIGERMVSNIDLGRLISWPDGRETAHSVSDLVPLDEDGKPAPLTGQINVSNEEIERAFSDRLDSSGEGE